MWLDLYLSHHPLFFLDETNLLDIHGTFLYLLHSCINQEDRANMPLQQDLTGTDLMDNLNLREEEEKKIKKRLSTNKKLKKIKNYLLNSKTYILLDPHHASPGSEQNRCSGP